MKKGKGKNSKLLPNSLRIISSCIKTVSTNASTAVRSAGASVAASISSYDRKEQVLWAGFDKLELAPAVSRRVLLLGYQNGFQVFDVEEASSLSELVSKRDGPVTFLQMLPLPAKCDGSEKYKPSYPLMVIVGGDETDRPSLALNNSYRCSRYGSSESQCGSSVDPPTAIRFYSLKSNVYVKVINFKSAVFMVRCSPRIVAVGLEEQIYCIDTVTLEKKFTVLTYPVTRFGEQGTVGISTGYGPMAVGSRWLAYPPSRPFLLNTGRLSPKKLASSVSPSTSPGSGSLMARYALESSKQLATGILTLGDMGYKKLSKYYPELLPEGSSSPGWKVGKLATSEPEDAGVVVVKDVVSLEVVSQFRAHTSPISALCFDPSGTLLVTASVHGNSINIFAIMPSQKDSDSGYHDWGISYVHLYKLHRGITTAVIQDICFSHDSQWIAIVSSKGTCHIFVLSAFGGDGGIQSLHSNMQGILYPVSSPPWWSTFFAVNEKCSSPPPPCTLSVVSRIKSSDSGLLNSVSNAASLMAGKICVPSGALAVIFHSSKTSNFGDVPSRASSLEHILVYTPSGFVVQHELQSSVGSEVIEFKTETWSGPQVQPQNEELKVKAEPIQWWDVCRRLDNLEREECIFGSIFDGQNEPEIDDDSKMFFQEKESPREKKLVKSDSLSTERAHWYLSNAEVQINSSRLPVWQKPEIHFHVMEPSGLESCSCGEFEIEKVSSHEVEIRQKDLLPVFDHFPVFRSTWINRSMPYEGRYPNGLSLDPKEKSNEASIIYYSEPPSFSSTESSDGGSSRRIENLLDLDRMNIDKSPMHTSHSPSELNGERGRNANLKNLIMNQRSGTAMTTTPEHSRRVDFHDDNNANMNMLCSSGDDISALHSDSTDSDILVPPGVEKTLDFEQFFKEGYCNKPDFCDPHQTTEVESNQEGNNSNSNEKDKPEDDDWIGGVFEFSEEVAG